MLPPLKKSSRDDGMLLTRNEKRGWVSQMSAEQSGASGQQQVAPQADAKRTEEVVD